ncbi:unnamed protein product [Paramecium primaurelia]|uniref:Protein kinase domain-containing protein n=1 Tax=Paramecium primaurelia TaxID=5886 RepID=A0A8S1P3M3_PARPR|nr:unnamed protein product [Paramecium primaurelia]
MIELKQKIGDGFSSNLYLCDYEGKQCVIKIYKLKFSDKLRQKEIQILKSLDHPIILKIINHDPHYDYFICQQLKIDLLTIIKNGVQLEIGSVKQILLELCETIQYLHKLNHVH